MTTFTTAAAGPSPVRRRGLTPFVAALALPAGLMLTPYHRSYDQVVMILPALFVLARSADQPSITRRWLARGLIFVAVVIPFFGYGVLVPVLAATAVLVVGVREA